ncbi:MAG TPA: hypothetical protein DHW34_02310 [Actinobacteria bacterium]|nr:hypothetical protein [Actinomycetota bacterium]
MAGRHAGPPAAPGADSPVRRSALTPLRGLRTGVAVGAVLLTALAVGSSALAGPNNPRQGATAALAAPSTPQTPAPSGMGGAWWWPMPLGISPAQIGSDGIPADRATDRASRISPRVTASAYAASGIPAVALKAYQRAARTLRAEDPQCGLRWELLAAIGRVESGHGTEGGAIMTTSGESVPMVVGPKLDGTGGFALVPDTDGGRYDGDKQYDRAVGPMQFLPSTWAAYASDGNKDGRSDVNNIWDASLGAAHLFCAGNTRLGTDRGLAANIYRYNHSESYVRLVLGIMNKYGASVRIIPTTTTAAQARRQQAAGKKSGSSRGSSSSAPAPRPSRTPTPAPTLTPKGPLPIDPGSGDPGVTNTGPSAGG